MFSRLFKIEKPLSFLSLDSLNKHWKTHMGSIHSFLGFVKHTPRELSKGWAYINKNMLSSSSLRKNKEVLVRNGGGNFWKEMCLCIHVSGSNSRSWIWHPPSSLNPSWEIHLSLVWPYACPYVGSSLSQCFQDHYHVVHMFKKSPSLIASYRVDHLQL